MTDVAEAFFSSDPSHRPHAHVAMDEDMMHAYQEVEQAALALPATQLTVSLGRALAHLARARAFNDEAAPHRPSPLHFSVGPSEHVQDVRISERGNE